MNPIENLWGRLTKDIHANMHQFAKALHIKLQFERSWFDLKSVL